VAQAGGAVGKEAQLGAGGGDVLGHDLLEQAGQHVLLVVEVQVHRPVRHPRPLRDLADARPEVALAREDASGRGQDAAALVLLLGGGGTAAGSHE
jgi:hypothetical protein